MSMTPPGPPNQGTAGLTDIFSALQGLGKHLSALVTTASNPAVYGSFTLNAAATTTVLQPAVKANSFISSPVPTNASAALLEGSAQKLYVSSISPGISFTVATGNGAPASGGQTFQYSIVSP